MKTRQNEINLKHLACADLMRMLAAGFSHPDFNVISRVADISSGLVMSIATDEVMKEHLCELISSVDEETIRTEYTRIFLFGGMPISESYCTGRFDCVADVSGFYSAFGVTPKSGEVPDSLMHELEFIALLCVKIHSAPTEDARNIAQEALTLFVSDHFKDFALKFIEKLSTYQPVRYYLSLMNLLQHSLDVYFKQEVAVT